MFTGIIKKTAKIASVKKQAGGLEVEIATPSGWRIQEGQSLSVNGICSTVAKISGKKLAFTYMPETIRKTTVRWWRKGDTVNLETSLRLGDPIDGHVVMGHVEGVGHIGALVNEKGDRLFKIETSHELISGIIKKGSIALDGVSLTVVDVAPLWFAVALIPYTIAHTNWKEKAVGSRLNIETDILGRQRLQTVLGSYATRGKSKISTKGGSALGGKKQK